MNRLVQGDVGSGKTAVAAAAGWMAASSGFQAALMAPTEILARQHFASLSRLLEPAGITVGLLTGSMPPAQKREMHRRIQAGEVTVNGETCTMRGKKLRPGDRAALDGVELEVV